MELLIPALAVAAVYKISADDKSNDKNNNNNNTNDKAPVIESFIPSLEEIKQFKVNSDLQAANPNGSSNAAPFPSNATVTDNTLNQQIYFDKSNQGIAVGANIPKIYSGSSESILQADDYVHNGQVLPSGKLRDRTFDFKNNSSVLDAYSGAGHTYLKKQEQAPLFKPESDLSWTHGMPNSSEFIKSRMNTTTKQTMDLPFKKTMVGKGAEMNDVGEDGCGGVNYGMNRREEWMPKTVDELRTKTNPKCEYGALGHEGPANSHIKKSAVQGEVQKYRPNTMYENTPNKWLVTTGAIHADRAPKTHVMRAENREQCNAIAPGGAHNTSISAPVAPQIYLESDRTDVDISKYATPAYSSEQNPYSNVGRNNHFLKNNNREYTAERQNGTTFGAVCASAIKSITAPLTDALRPTRKEEQVCNARVFGNVNRGELGATYSENPITAKTTARETTIYSFNGMPHLSVTPGGYQVSNPNIDQTERDKMKQAAYMGTAGAGGQGERKYDAAYAYVPEINDCKSVKCGFTPSGVNQQFNPTQNMTIARPDKKDRWCASAPVGNSISSGPAVDTFGKLTAENSGGGFDTNISDRLDPHIVASMNSNPYVVTTPSELYAKKNN